MKYDGFSVEDQTIKWFWEVVRELSEADVGKLLAFMTGARRATRACFWDL